jgi:hypothetical protein
MTGPYAVTCEEMPDGTYSMFLHEADILLLALMDDVLHGKMAADHARELWRPYREFLPDLYEPDYLEVYEDGFPLNDEMGLLPGTNIFADDACEANVLGVAMHLADAPGFDDIFEVQNKASLENLQRKLFGRYRIVEIDASVPGDWSEGVAVAEQLIGWARERGGLNPA